MTERSYAVVTGSADGLGRAFAILLAREGWHLALVDIEEPGNQETLRLVQEAGGSAQCEQMDVRNAESWQALQDRLLPQWPRLDLLINNAGVGGAGEVGDFTLDNWRWLIDSDLMSVVYGCHTLVGWLKRNPGRGRIINVSSTSAELSLPCMAAYCAAKSGVVKLSESMYVELSKFGVGVTVVVAGFFQSGLMRRARTMNEFQRNFSALSMKRSPITAEMVARAALRGSQRGRFKVNVIPFKLRMYRWFNRLAPNLFLKYVSYVWRSSPPPYM